MMLCSGNVGWLSLMSITRTLRAAVPVNCGFPWSVAMIVSLYFSRISRSSTMLVRTMPLYGGLMVNALSGLPSTMWYKILLFIPWSASLAESCANRTQSCYDFIYQAAIANRSESESRLHESRKSGSRRMAKDIVTLTAFGLFILRKWRIYTFDAILFTRKQFTTLISKHSLSIVFINWNFVSATFCKYLHLDLTHILRNKTNL